MSTYINESQVEIVTVDDFRAKIAPSAPTLDAFMVNVTPLHERITLNVSQNRRLAGLRDALLPKLLNGEIELPAVLSACDAQAGEAVAKEVS